MSILFVNASIAQSNKRADRIKKEAEKALNQVQSVIAQPSGFDLGTGAYIATTSDGGQVQYKLGNYQPQPNLISIVSAKNSLIGFGDWM